MRGSVARRRAERAARLGPGFLGADLRRWADVSYWTKYCDDSGCDHMRCGQLVELEMRGLAFGGLALEFAGPAGSPDELLAYAVERWLVRSDLADPQRYELGTAGGYYGEELGPVRLAPEVARRVGAEIEHLRSLAPARRLRATLERERPASVPLLRAVTRWEIREVPLSELVHRTERRLDPTTVTGYRHHVLPRALCVAHPSGALQVVDGAHRLAAVKRAQRVRVVVGT